MAVARVSGMTTFRKFQTFQSARVRFSQILSYHFYTDSKLDYFFLSLFLSFILFSLLFLFSAFSCPFFSSFAFPLLFLFMAMPKTEECPTGFLR
jgi:hypothetical protein